MNSYGQLAVRYLRQQRRKSILTIVGIVLSVALISAIGTMGQAIKDNLLQQQIRENGSFHFVYYKATPELYDKLRSNALVDKVGAYQSGGAATKLASSTIYLDEISKDGFGLLPLRLQAGRLPTTANEVVLEEWATALLPGKPGIGDTLTLNGPDGGSHAYKLVGLVQNRRASAFSENIQAITLLDTAVLEKEAASVGGTTAKGGSASDSDAATGGNGKTQSSDSKAATDGSEKENPSSAVDAKTDASGGESTLQLFVKLRPGVGIAKHMPAFRELAAKPNEFSANERVLAVMGESSDNGLNRALGIIFGTLVGLVVLSTVAVIYNAFHISVLERMRQFGLLRTIGASPGQLRNLVYREAALLAVIGIPLGLAVGWAALSLVLWGMTKFGFRILQFEEFHLELHAWIMVGSVIIGLASVFLAAWLPARKASRISPIDAVRGTGNIVRESIRRTRIPSLLQAMGIEGKMASQNIRRNKTKFRITTFSIAVSVSLFVVFHYFTQEALSTVTDVNENDRIAFTVKRTGLNPTTDIASAATIADISETPGVRGVYGMYKRFSGVAFVPEERMNAEYLGWTQSQPLKAESEGKAARQVPVSLSLFDEARFEAAKRYMTSGELDMARMNAEDGVWIVKTVKPTDRKGKRNLLELADLRVGDGLRLSVAASKTVEVKIAGILSMSPFDAPFYSDQMTIIGTKTTFAKWGKVIPKQEYGTGTTMLGLDVAMKDGADPEPVRQKLEQLTRTVPDTQMFDYVKQQKEQRQFNLQMQIFVYGFLTVIGLIGSLNIVNTVQTNLFLRRREFGLLQAVGMTMSQIRKMSLSEGIWYGVIGSAWGLVFGGGLAYFLYVQLSGVEGRPFLFPWPGATLACGLALLVGLVSVWGPMRRLERSNLLDVLREEG